MTYMDFARIPGPKRLKVLTVRERFYELCKGFLIDISGEFQLFMKLTNKHTGQGFNICPLLTNQSLHQCCCTAFRFESYSQHQYCKVE